MVYVTSAVRSSCVGSLAPRPGLGRGVDLARDQGSSESLIPLEGEALIPLETGAWARR